MGSSRLVAPSIEQRYVLGGGSPEVDRLRIQSLALEPFAESLLDEVGVSAGSSALDLACGPIGLLRPLSARVGPTGRVVGLDLDPAEVTAADSHCRSLGLSNVRVLPGDAFRTQFDEDSFDLVHAWLLITPVGRAHDLVTEMMRVAKPGGAVVLEEADVSAWSCFPRSAGFEQLQQVILECFRRGGGNFESGREVFALLRRSGLTEVRSRAVAPTLHDGHPFMRSTVHFAASLRRRILEDGLLIESELDEAVADVERAVARPETSMISFLIVQAWGRKPVTETTGR